MQKGIGVALATGRTELMTRKYVREAGITLPIIANNGSLVVDVNNGLVLYKKAFLSETLQNLVEYCISQKKDYFIYTIDRVYYSSNSKKIQIMHRYNNMVELQEQISLTVLPEDSANVLKCLPFHGENCVFKVLVSDPLESDRLYFDSVLNAEAVSSQKDALDIMPIGSTKGDALGFLSNYLKVDRQDVFAFGDNFNDLSMLEFSGYSIVPDNGVPEAKAVANYVTSSNNEDGVAKAVYSFVLPKIGI
jgi:Cof subfamily protein (haloacid dehalogenase superfamily)